MKTFRSPLFVLFSLLMTAVGLGVVAGAADKMAPADLVAKHIAAIGSPDARAKVSGTRIKGGFELIVKAGGTGTSEGQVVMASHRDQNLVNMAYNSDEPATSFRYDGSKTTVTQFRPGRHTPLEHFFHEHQEIVSDGLVGGVLSEAWPLFKLQEKSPKLEYAGMKKIDGRQAHALRYKPQKGSELSITLFFDAETFQHLRTEYEQTVYSTKQTRIPGSPGRLPSVTDQRSAPQRLTAYESFSDFRPEGGLNLPHVYKFELSVQSDVRPLLISWTFNLSEFAFNAPLDKAEFVVGNETVKPD